MTSALKALVARSNHKDNEVCAHSLCTYWGCEQIDPNIRMPNARFQFFAQICETNASGEYLHPLTILKFYKLKYLSDIDKILYL